MNPLGKVPVLELDDGTLLPESNAILFWLSAGTDYWPESAFDQAQALRWLFFEQRSHMPNVGGARYWLTMRKSRMTQLDHEPLRRMQADGMEALRVLDRHLQENEYVVGERYSIVDIAFYAYTHLAHESGIDLTRLSAIGPWLERIKGQPGYVGIHDWNGP